MFDKGSFVARTWAEAVKKGDKSIEEVPELSNLIDVVTSIIPEEVESSV